jgi:hypothetical protein
LAIVVSLSRKIVVQKQPSPRATMAALYPMRPAGSYTTPWDTIFEIRVAARIRRGEDVFELQAPRRLNATRTPNRTTER